MPFFLLVLDENGNKHKKLTRNAIFVVQIDFMFKAKMSKI